MKAFCFYLGLGLICTHELDALTQQEWRLLYILRSLPDALAESLFIALHVPLFALLFWLTHHANLRLRAFSRLALMSFLMIHVGLHWRLSDHALYHFHTLLSVSLIWGAGLTGLGYLLLSLPKRG